MLADLITEAALRGGLDGLTLWPTQDGRWQASTRRRGDAGWHVEVADDPAAALNAALAWRCPARRAAGPTNHGVFG